MPFIKFIPPDTSNVERPVVGRVIIPQSPNQIPLFIIPGIFLTASELRWLALFLYDLSNDRGDDRDIYFFIDDTVVPATPTQNTLKTLAQKIVISLQNCMPYNCALYALVGYSLGGAILAEVAQQLTTDHQKNSLFIIDGPTAECSQQYLSVINETVFKDLLKIVVTAAQIAELNPTTIADISLTDLENASSSTQVSENGIDEATAPSKSIAESHALQIVRLVDQLAQRVTDISMAETVEEITFAKLINQAKQGLYNLATYTPSNTAVTSDIAALITYQTAVKYHSKDGGWAAYTANTKVPFTLLTNETLQSADHLALMDAPNSKLLAGEAIKHFNREPILNDPREFFFYLLSQQVDLYIKLMPPCSENPDPADPLTAIAIGLTTLSAAISTYYASKSSSPTAALAANAVLVQGCGTTTSTRSLSHSASSPCLLTRAQAATFFGQSSISDAAAITTAVTTQTGDIEQGQAHISSPNL